MELFCVMGDCTNYCMKSDIYPKHTVFSEYDSTLEHTLHSRAKLSIANACTKTICIYIVLLNIVES